MGVECSASAQFGINEQKQSQIKQKQKTLTLQLQSKDFIKGSTLMISNVSSSIIDTANKNNMNSLPGLIIDQLKTFAYGENEIVFEIIVQHFLELLQDTIATGSASQQYRGYPIITKNGFGMVYFSYYIEKLPAKNEKPNQKSAQKQTSNIPLEIPSLVLITGFKLVVPPSPKSNYHLGGYIALSSVQREADKSAIQNAYWRVIQQGWSTDQLKQDQQRSLKIKKMRQLEAQSY